MALQACFVPRVRNERQGTLWGANRTQPRGVTDCGVENTEIWRDTCAVRRGQTNAPAPAGATA